MIQRYWNHFYRKVLSSQNILSDRYLSIILSTTVLNTKVYARVTNMPRSIHKRTRRAHKWRERLNIHIPGTCELTKVGVSITIHPDVGLRSRIRCSR
jgi:hypothetical protein